jgi:2,3-diketo-5-methylthio-1-phosphopentane phosphatase
MDRKRPIIFSDFDGTFTARDVGNRIFTYFSGGENRRLVDEWKKGLMTSRECLLREASLTRVSKREFYRFLDDFELARGAKEFWEATRAQQIPFIILSDGLDLYIEYILAKNNLPIQFHANKASLVDGRLKIEFPYGNNSCPRCGSCKGERIKETVAEIAENREGVEIIFIGDGLSDICALPESDVIFARGDLLNYCQVHDFKAIEYGDFFDILEWMKKSGRVAG